MRADEMNYKELTGKIIERVFYKYYKLIFKFTDGTSIESFIGYEDFEYGEPGIILEGDRMEYLGVELMDKKD